MNNQNKQEVKMGWIYPENGGIEFYPIVEDINVKTNLEENDKNEK